MQLVLNFSDLLAQIILQTIFYEVFLCFFLMKMGSFYSVPKNVFFYFLIICLHLDVFFKSPSLSVRVFLWHSKTCLNWEYLQREIWDPWQGSCLQFQVRSLTIRCQVAFLPLLPTRSFLDSVLTWRRKGDTSSIWTHDLLHTLLQSPSLSNFSMLRALPPPEFRSTQAWLCWRVNVLHNSSYFFYTNLKQR